MILNFIFLKKYLNKLYYINMNNYDATSILNKYPYGTSDPNFQKNQVDLDFITNSNKVANIETFSGGKRKIKEKNIYNLKNSDLLIKANYPLEAARKINKEYNRKNINIINIKTKKIYKYKL